jgi:glutamate racemase
MIGIFDSGFGGLTTLREWHKITREYDVVFLGDSARTPYGSRSTETVTRFVEEGVNRLFDLGATIVLLACNTASADALRHLQAKYPNRKTLGVIIPAAELALQQSRFGRIGVIGTRGTVNTKNYDREIEKLKAEHYKPTDKRALEIPNVTSVAAPLLVPLVEEGWIKKPETRSILKKYLFPLKHANIDTLILGCTHYPLLQKEFERKMGKRCTVINSAKAQAERFADYLQRHPEIESNLSKNGTTTFYTTDDPKRFRELGNGFLDQKIGAGSVQKIELP